MRRWMAAALSASMVMGAFPVAAMAEETAAVSDEITFVMTAEGESLTAVISAVYGEDGTTSISAGVTLPAAVAGEETTFTMDDMLRLSDGDIYLNAELALDLYYQMTGDTSMTMLATMVGINQPWIKIPALDFSGLEATDAPALSEDVVTALYDCIAPFEVTETDGGMEIAFDGADAASCIESFVNVLKQYSGELRATTEIDTTAFDYKTVFEDYILAAAEGISEVNPEMTVEDGVALIHETFDTAIAENGASAYTSAYVGEDALTALDEFAADAKESLTEDNLNGLIVLNDSGFTCDIVVSEEGEEVGSINAWMTVEEDVYKFALSLTDEGETMEILSGTVNAGDGFAAELMVNDGEELIDFDLSVLSTTEGEYAEIAAPEEAVLLRDVLKNAVIIYGSMMMMEETAVTE